jgi:ABC-type bacteriocin/lantibiotic exporter with double-glycine peptidase domain
VSTYHVCFVVLFIGSFLRMTLCFYVSLQSSINLHNTIFRRVLRAPMQFFENNPLGRILNR